MSSCFSDFLKILEERDFLYQATDIKELDKLCSEKKIVGYIGFDATAKSLQVGNLSAIMLLRWLQKTGHTPMVLIGGGTSRIGDPSFRNAARPIMSLEQVQENVTGISLAFSKLLNFETGNNKAIMVNNVDWLTQLNYLDFLRDYGSFFTVNKMLSFENVRSRLDKEEPLSFLEFNYMIIQAYDFYYLNKNYDCILQMGGSDQWGNIVNGVDLTRRLGKRVYGVTAPLVTNANGVKMGKTAQGAIWLNPDMCSPYTYWQFWRNTADRDIQKYLKKFTELPLKEIEYMTKDKEHDVNEIKKILADEATALLHGKEVLDSIHKTVQSIFSGIGEENSAMNSKELSITKLPIRIDDLFVYTGLCKSKGDFKRLVSGSGASIDGKIIKDYTFLIKKEDFSKTELILSVGKKNHTKVVLI